MIKRFRLNCTAVTVFSVVLLLAIDTRAQSPAPPDAHAGANSGEPSTVRRVEGRPGQETGDSLEQLKARVELLESIVEKQRGALAELEKRLTDLAAKDGPQPASLGLAKKNDETGGAAPAREAVAAAQPQDVQRKMGNDNQAASQSREPVSGAGGWGRNHAILRSAEGDFETEIGGYVQLDFHGYASGSHPPNTFLVRRARLFLDGRVQKYFDFRIEGDFADTASTLLRDAYLRIHRIDELQLTFGQVRVPISQEELRSDAYQDFVERSMVNNLVPSRSPGIMASGVIGDGIFEYQVGAFNGKGLLANNTTGTPESAIRLRFNPWKNAHNFWAKGFIFGGAYTQGRSLGTTSVRGLTESRSITWFTPEPVAGKYIRANGEFTWLLGPAALRGEYDQTNQERESLGVGGTNAPGVVAKGYTAQFTYLLTGETKPEADVIVPRHSLFGEGSAGHGLGAWELKARFASLQISDSSFRSNRAESFFFGPNVYFNRFVRFMLDLGFERFNDPARSPNPSDRNYFVMLSRVQVTF